MFKVGDWVVPAARLQTPLFYGVVTRVKGSGVQFNWRFEEFPARWNAGGYWALSELEPYTPSDGLVLEYMQWLVREAAGV